MFELCCSGMIEEDNVVKLVVCLRRRCSGSWFSLDNMGRLSLTNEGVPNRGTGVEGGYGGNTSHNPNEPVPML